MSIRTRTIAISALAVANLLLAPSAMAAQPTAVKASKKPAVGLTAPATATVGEPVKITSVFNARTRGCFSPEIEWGDEDGSSVGVTVGFCTKGRGKPKFETEKDTAEHTYTRPGVYTIKVTAAAMPNGGGIVSPKGVKVKGKRTMTAQITVTGPNGEMPDNASAGSASPASTPGASESKMSCDTSTGIVNIGCRWGQGGLLDGPNSKPGESGFHTITSLTSSNPSVVKVGDTFTQGGYSGIWLDAVGSGTAQLCATYEGIQGQSCSPITVR